MDAMKFDKLLEETLDDFDANDHQSSSADTPLREDAFDLSDDEKISRIEKDVANVLETLGMDMTDDSLKGTPKRVAKMFVQEIFGGLNPKRSPKLSTFDNKYKYGHMLVEKNITLYSTCEHHLLPIVGKAHVAYISNGYCDWVIQNESNCRLLCQKTSSTGTTYTSSCTYAYSLPLKPKMSLVSLMQNTCVSIREGFGMWIAAQLLQNLAVLSISQKSKKNF